MLLGLFFLLFFFFLFVFFLFFFLFFFSKFRKSILFFLACSPPPPPPPSFLSQVNYRNSISNMPRFRCTHHKSTYKKESNNTGKGTHK